MNNVMDFKRAPKDERTVMDTWVLTSESIEAWRIPPFQRPLRVNDKVRQIGEEIKTTEVIPGVITLGIVDTGLDRSTYLMDGQHRIEGFRISGLKEAFADMRILHFSNMADMGVAFVNLNSQIVKMRPDDILRGMEGHIEGVRIVRERCNFVGYDQVRRGTHSPILGMSVVVKSWASSARETPTMGGMGSALDLARDLTEDSALQLSVFLNIAVAAWGRDPEYSRLWGALNLSMCMWLYRRLVLDKIRTGSQRAIVLTSEQFKKCMMSLSADREYVDWLVGRALRDTDRSPCFGRIRQIFLKRLTTDLGEKPKMPKPDWAAH